MAKFQLTQGEQLVGNGMMAYEVRKFPARRTRGNLYVTSKRVCYYESMTNYVYMDLPLTEIAGYSVKKMLFTFVQIHDREGKVYTYSGFSAEKLQGWLDQVGVQRLD